MGGVGEGRLGFMGKERIVGGKGEGRGSICNKARPPYSRSLQCV